MKYLVALFISAVLFIPTLTVAQTLCGMREDVVKNLEKTYKEKSVSLGLASNGAVIEVLASKEGITFTIILTRPNGLSCIMAAGENWEMYLDKLYGKKGSM